MRSRLCKRHFKGNGAFDGVWRYDSQKRYATKEAIFILYEWIEGREKTPEYRDAIYALLDMYGDSVKAGCKRLWVASLPRVTDNPDMCLAYFDAGIELITRYFRRHQGLFKITTGWEHYNESNPMS